MSSPSPEVAGAQAQTRPAAPKALPKRNPVAEMMGLPRMRLPSRNWMIFFAVTGGFLGAVQYDRREKRRVQKKWCDLVSHQAQDSLPINQTRRKLTVFLAAPPGDGLRPTRDYFREYIKPVLVAAALDYDVIEGRKEGDVRYGTAEQIRRSRRKQGEVSESTAQAPPDPEQLVELQRTRAGVQQEPGPKGDLVIGRHTWKEYVRGIHEGWLGPLDNPTPPVEKVAPVEDTAETPGKTEEKPAEETKPVDEKASYLPTASYQTSSLAPSTPVVLEASAAIPQPHILGFLNTPIRIYRYLNQRHLADQIGRETAAIVMGMTAPYKESSATGLTSTTDLEASPVTPAPSGSDVIASSPSSSYAQQHLLEQEEPEWHKSVRKPRDDDKERTWLDDVVIDQRIAERMRTFQLDPVEEERAERIGQGLEKALGYVEREGPTGVQLGNLDDPDA